MRVVQMAVSIGKNRIAGLRTNIVFGREKKRKKNQKQDSGDTRDWIWSCQIDSKKREQRKTTGLVLPCEGLSFGIDITGAGQSVHAKDFKGLS